MIVGYKKGIKFGTKNFSFSVNKENFYVIFIKSNAIQRKIDRIEATEYGKRLKEQMSYTKDKIREVYSITMSVHEKLIEKTTTIAGLTNHEQNQAFSELLKNILNESRESMKKRFLEMLEIYLPEDNNNDSLEHIENSFFKYKKQATSSIISEVSNKIKDRWIKNKWIQFEDIEKEMDKVIPEVRAKVEEALTMGIQIQLKYQKKIKELNAELKEFTKEQ
jgi:hypothetical protein